LRRAVIEVVVQIAFVINRFQHLIQQFAGMAFAVGMRFDAVDELQNSRSGRSGVQSASLRAALDGGKQRTLPLPGECAQHFQRRLTDTAFRRGDRADERRIIVFIRNQAQIRNDVFDFSAVKKLWPPEMVYGIRSRRSACSITRA
jgi:hypothetical protein